MNINKLEHIFLFLLFCHISSPEKHSFMFVITTSTGIPNIPGFMITLLIDHIQVNYCDVNKKMEINKDAMKNMFDDNPQLFQYYKQNCFANMPSFFQQKITSIMQLYNHDGGVHILQVTDGIEWDEGTKESRGFSHYVYDGEDFMSLNLKDLTWVALSPKAAIIKPKWDADKDRLQTNNIFLNQFCPKWLKMYLNYSSSYKSDPPSVSLLRQSPSSPVSCHATGFYPDRAQMFWRKDGEEIHEDVDQGEILPNQDGTFQMRVDLNISADEDWSRYECVFKLHDAENTIVTKLDKAAIRSNEQRAGIKNNKEVSVVVGVVVGLMMLTVSVTTVIFWRKTIRGYFSNPVTRQRSTVDKNVIN